MTWRGPLGVALLSSLVLFGESVLAHQPVMDMAPRWDDGWGIQTRTEAEWGGYGRRTQWLEGVYTFDRSVRVTAKIPLRYGDNLRVGDVVLAVPLKYYTNFQRATQNIGLTPQVRLPVGGLYKDPSLSDGSVDVGLSLSYSTEGFILDPWLPNLAIYQLYDLFYWLPGSPADFAGGRGRADRTLGFDANVGIKVLHSNQYNAGLFVMWDVAARHKERGFLESASSAVVQTGPILVPYWQNWMARFEVRRSVYDHNATAGGFSDYQLSVGIGVTQ